MCHTALRSLCLATWNHWLPLCLLPSSSCITSVKEWLCVGTIPSASLCLDQTDWPKLHWRNKWAIVSSCQLHRTHGAFLVCIPNLLNLSIVRSLPLITLYRHRLNFGVVLLGHMNWLHSIFDTCLYISSKLLHVKLICLTTVPTPVIVTLGLHNWDPMYTGGQPTYTSGGNVLLSV